MESHGRIQFGPGSTRRSAQKGSDNFHSACVSYIVSFPKTQSSGLNLEDRRSTENINIIVLVSTQYQYYQYLDQSTYLQWSQNFIDVKSNIQQVCVSISFRKSNLQYLHGWVIKLQHNNWSLCIVSHWKGRQKKSLKLLLYQAKNTFSIL